MTDKLPVPGSTLKADPSKRLKRTELNRNTEATRGFNERGRKSSAESLQRSGRESARKSASPRRPISPASPQQRAAVKGECCVVCGAYQSEYVAITAMHLWPRGRGGCDSRFCVLPGCVRPGGVGCHDRQERGEIDLLAILVTDWDRYRPYVQHALLHSLPVELLEKLAGARIEWAAAVPVLSPGCAGRPQ